MRLSWILLLFILVDIYARFRDRYACEDLRLSFFDVGQGDSILVRFPKGVSWLIDAGGGTRRWDWGKKELFLELARMGVLRLEAGILSHPDTDHALGFRGLLPQIAIDTLYWNAVYERSNLPILKELHRLAGQAHTRVTPLDHLEQGTISKVAYRLLPLPGAKRKNDSPLVLWLSYGGCRVLFAGDAEKAAEGHLTELGWGPVEILKVNHHGSRTSSQWSFLKQMDPRWAVVSVGARNRYGHPAPSVVQRFRGMGIRWLRTDFHGYVEFTITPQGTARCVSAQGSCGEWNCARRASH